MTEFGYDLTGRPTQTLFPDGSDEFRTYQFGQLKNWKTRRNQAKTIIYDARGRETSHSWDDGMTSGVTRSWDDANRLLSITNNISALDYQHDSAGQVLVEGSTVVGSGGGTNTVHKQLNYFRYPSGEVSRITYPNGSTAVNRFYTVRGQLKEMGWGSGSTSYVYLADGKVDSQVNLNGIAISFGYDGRGMISSVSHKNASNQSLAYREYWRDERDRIVAWKRGPSGGPNGMEDERGDRYEYDPEGQLKKATYRAATPEGTPSGALRSDEFQYDELGNRAGANRVASRGAVNFSRRDNGLNQYLNWTPSAIYQDDNFPWPAPTPPVALPGNGVTMAEGWISASFNALNQPMGIWSPIYGGGASAQYVWFGYDPLGRCVKRWTSPLIGGHAPPPSTNPATYYYYDGWTLVQEGSSGNVADRVYVHGGRVDEIVASRAGGEWRYHHYDARGHCMLLTDTSGGIREQYDYDAFGMPYFYNAAGVKLGASTQWGNRFLFTGREWLQDLRIYDYRNRLYQPELGRFLQPDPTGFEAGDYNLYRYCHNDPVNRSDPTGLVEPIQEDFRWKMNCFFDGGNSFQGSYGEYMNRSPADAGQHMTSGAGSPSKPSLATQAAAAVDQWAPWAKEHNKEVAGTINAEGEIKVGPEKNRSLRGSHPGEITRDTVAIWHIHLFVPPNPYIFSYPPFGRDTISLKCHPNLSHYVGVLNAPPGQLTIFAHTPEMPYLHYPRLGPQPFPQPPDE